MSVAVPVNLIGMSQDALAVLLAQAQAAYHKLRMGGAPVSLSYGQGDGERSVTYSPAQRPDLLRFISEIQTAMGNVPAGRRASRVIFR